MLGEQQFKPYSSMCISTTPTGLELLVLTLHKSIIVSKTEFFTRTQDKLNKERIPMSIILNVPYFSVNEDGVGRVYCYKGNEQLESIPLFSKKAASKCVQSLLDGGLLNQDEHRVIKDQVVKSRLPNGYLPQDVLALAVNVALDDLIDCRVDMSSSSLQPGSEKLN